MLWILWKVYSLYINNLQTNVQYLDAKQIIQKYLEFPKMMWNINRTCFIIKVYSLTNFIRNWNLTKHSLRNFIKSKLKICKIEYNNNYPKCFKQANWDEISTFILKNISKIRKLYIPTYNFTTYIREHWQYFRASIH